MWPSVYAFLERASPVLILSVLRRGTVSRPCHGCRPQVSPPTACVVKVLEIPGDLRSRRGTVRRPCHNGVG